jgi:NADH-quinone oxidoreductase subunit J
MTLVQILFLIVAAVGLLAGLMVVTVRNLFHAALWLIVSLFAVAVLFAMLDAGFLAVVQVVIYIGAIAILIIFAIMLTRREALTAGAQENRLWPVAGVLCALVFLGLAWSASQLPGAPSGPVQLPGSDALVALGTALVSPDQYVVPFEVASVLLLAALIGSVVIAGDRNRSR